MSTREGDIVFVKLISKSRLMTIDYLGSRSPTFAGRTGLNMSCKLVLSDNPPFKVVNAYELAYAICSWDVGTQAGSSRLLPTCPLQFFAPSGVAASRGCKAGNY